MDQKEKQKHRYHIYVCVCVCILLAHWAAMSEQLVLPFRLFHPFAEEAPPLYKYIHVCVPIFMHVQFWLIVL